MRDSNCQSSQDYLDLMKKALTDSLYLDHPMALLVPVEIQNRWGGWLARLPFLMLKAVLKPLDIHLVEHQRSWYTSQSWSTDELRTRRFEGRDWPARAHTMIGTERLNYLQDCVSTVLLEGVEGDLIETGVWRGGASIFMKAILKAYGEEHRRVFVADSFAGLPPPNTSRYPQDSDSNFHQWKELSVSRGQVEDNFRAYDLLDDHVVFLEGWFSQTLPAAPIDKLAILRLDGDMYESTIQALQALYSKLSEGAFVIVDDYHLEPCREAVSDFIKSSGIRPDIRNSGARGVYWRVTPDL